MAIDTAGLRARRLQEPDRVVRGSTGRKRAIERADVVLLLIDAESTISQVDEQLAQMVVASHKPVVIVVNKWDAVEGRADDKGRPVTPERPRELRARSSRGCPSRRSR
ncbi:MAG: GTPase [Phycisphaerales bacterium]